MNLAFFLKPKNDVAFLVDDYSVRQGLEKMCYHGYTAIPVLDVEGHYLTTINEGDFLWYVVSGENTENGHVDIRKAEDVKVKDIMKPDRNPPVKITATMEELFMRSMEQNYVPVIDDRGYFIGIVTRRDLIKYLYDNTKKITIE